MNSSLVREFLEEFSCYINMRHESRFSVSRIPARVFLRTKLLIPSTEISTGKNRMMFSSPDIGKSSLG